MPATTSDTQSVPYRRGSVNTPRRENSQTRARNEAIRRVQTDERLTYGCRNFYQLLDQHYGWKNGLVYPKLKTLVLRFDLCRRSCQRWIAQLREHGYLTTEKRNGRACRHRLTWAQSVASEAAPVSHHGLIVASEEIIEHAGVGVDSTRSADEIEMRVSADGEDSNAPGWNPGDRGCKSRSVEESGAGGLGYPDTLASCPHCHGAGERTYVHHGHWDSLGRRVPERRERGKCGCRV